MQAEDSCSVFLLVPDWGALMELADARPSEGLGLTQVGTSAQRWSSMLVCALKVASPWTCLESNAQRLEAAYGGWEWSLTLGM